MNFEDLSYSGLLSLGLDYSERPKDRNNSQISSSESDDHRYFPSLNLALSLEPRSKVDVESRSVVLERQVSSISVVSSLSNSDLTKSKKDVHTSSIHALGVGRLVLDHDQDEDESAVRKKLKLDRYQSRILEDSFKDHSTLNLVSTLFNFIEYHVLLHMLQICYRESQACLRVIKLKRLSTNLLILMPSLP